MVSNFSLSMSQVKWCQYHDCVQPTQWDRFLLKGLRRQLMGSQQKDLMR